MTTMALPRPRMAREHRFFLFTAIAMAVLIVAAFSLDLLLARASFGLPWIFHLHAVVFMGWVALYVAQNALATAGPLAWHRRLGWAALAWLPAMVVLAIVMTLVSVRDHGGPPFFGLNEFLFGNVAGILYFAAVSAAGLILRRRTDWHRRLMFCGMASLTGPAFGRLLPIPLMMPWAWVAVALVAPSIFPLLGMLAERRAGRIHPAWAPGWGGFVLSFLLAEALAVSPLGVAATQAVVAGTAGAARPMQAYWP